MCLGLPLSVAHMPRDLFIAPGEAGTSQLSYRPVDWSKKRIFYSKTKGALKFSIKNVSMSDGACKCEFDVTEDHVNRDGHFHVGMTTTLVNVVASYALLAHGSGHSGVSTNIHVANLKPAFPGDVLSVDAKVFRIEHPLAYMEVELSKKNTGEIVARGQHTMFMVPPIDYEP